MRRAIDYGLGPREVRAMHLPDDAQPNIQIKSKRDHTGRDVIHVVCDDPFVFVQMQDVGEHSKLFKSRLFTVVVHEADNGFPFWISLRNHQSTADAHDWRDMQMIKNALAGPQFDAVELYPSEDRLVDESNQFHLWVFRERLPIGMKDREVLTAAEHDRIKELQGEEGLKGRQRPFDRKTEAQRRSDDELRLIIEQMHVRIYGGPDDTEEDE